jgi:hypothetical protein
MEAQQGLSIIDQVLVDTTPASPVTLEIISRLQHFRLPRLPVPPAPPVAGRNITSGHRRRYGSQVLRDGGRDDYGKLRSDRCRMEYRTAGTIRTDVGRRTEGSQSVIDPTGPG